MSRPVSFSGFVRAMKAADAVDVADMVIAAAAEFGGTDVVVYLVDFEQQVLEPLPDRSSHAEVPRPEEVGTTIAGRAFLQRQAMTSERSHSTRVWVPILEGSDPTGVLALTVANAAEPALRTCEDLGVLAGYLIATQARITDLYTRHRRRKAMTLAASMQWDLLPPLTLTCPRVAVAGMLEPAYEVGGDCFDYALNSPHLDLAFMDSMGHGLGSALVAALAMGVYRHDRRQGRTLERIYADLDATIAEECGDEAFITGFIGRLDLTSGGFAWINAGHPPPLLVRHGRVIGAIEGARALPWGVGHSPPQASDTGLEPGDTLVFYTDGVVEARGRGGADFGADRLADLIGRHASDDLPVSLIVRLVVRAVLEHHGGRLHDDASLLMVSWPGPVGPTGADG